jgi:hypothetical protein
MSSHKEHGHHELYAAEGSRKTRAHTPVDHREGGPALTLHAGPTEWAAVELIHVRADRAPAAVAASQTLIELLDKEVDMRSAAIFVSKHQRRVASFVWLPGHEAYSKLQHAWDEHHLEREHREAMEKRDLSLCRVSAISGDPTIGPGTHTVWAIEKLALNASRAADILMVIEQSRPTGFVGAVLFSADDGTHSYLAHRWEHKESQEAFRGSPAAIQAIGPAGQTGDAFELYQPVWSFAPPAT